MLLQLEFPWLTLEEIKSFFMSSSKITAVGSSHSATPAGGAGGTRAENDEELAEDVIAAVDQELEEARLTLEGHANEVYFVTKVLGGEWSQRRSGAAASDIV